MKYDLKNELPIVLIALLPFVYLLTIWNALPQTVPTHWNIHGEIDGTGTKETLILVPLLLPVLTYLIFSVAPFIDPKQRLQHMGDKLMKLKFAVTFIMTVLALVILYSSLKQELNPNHMTMLLGVLFTILGNFFPTLKPNYLIGIRVPWTINNDDNWKQTHQFAGKLWVIGGILIVLSGLYSDSETNNIFSLSIILIIALTPVIYSYRLYRRDKNKLA